MGKKSKGNRIYVILESTEGGSHSRYVTTKNRKNSPERLELKKFDPFLRRYAIYKETR